MCSVESSNVHHETILIAGILNKSMECDDPREVRYLIQIPSLISGKNERQTPRYCDVLITKDVITTNVPQSSKCSLLLSVRGVIKISLCHYKAL